MTHPAKFTTNKAMADVVRAAVRSGWTVTVSGGGHLRMTREGCTTIFAPASPRNDWAATKTQAHLRRAEAARRPA